MDLTPAAWMPASLGANRRRLPNAPQFGSTHVAAPASAVQLPMQGSDGTSTIRGEADGPDYVLSSGIVIRRRRVGKARVTDAQLAEAIRGVMLLPIEDQKRIARANVPIELLPLTSLGEGTLGPILGSTAIDGIGGMWSPTLVRVVVGSPQSTRAGSREAIGEIVQHELGHVVAVLTNQDRSEEAAERYALVH